MKFGLPEAWHTEKTCILVIQVGTVEMGILVDKVSEVINIVPEEIEDTPRSAWASTPTSSLAWARPTAK